MHRPASSKVLQLQLHLESYRVGVGSPGQSVSPHLGPQRLARIGLRLTAFNRWACSIAHIRHREIFRSSIRTSHAGLHEFRHLRAKGRSPFSKGGYWDVLFLSQHFLCTRRAAWCHMQLVARHLEKIAFGDSSLSQPCQCRLPVAHHRQGPFAEQLHARWQLRYSTVSAAQRIEGALGRLRHLLPAGKKLPRQQRQNLLSSPRAAWLHHHPAWTCKDIRERYSRLLKCFTYEDGVPPHGQGTAVQHLHPGYGGHCRRRVLRAPLPLHRIRLYRRGLHGARCRGLRRLEGQIVGTWPACLTTLCFIGTTVPTAAMATQLLRSCRTFTLGGRQVRRWLIRRLGRNITSGNIVCRNGRHSIDTPGAPSPPGARRNAEQCACSSFVEVLSHLALAIRITAGPPTPRAHAAQPRCRPARPSGCPWTCPGAPVHCP